MSLSRMHRRVVTILAFFVIALLCAGPGSAHTSLTRSEPPNGGKVSVGRSSFTLWFSEPVSAAASTFGLRTLAGVAVPVRVTKADGPDGNVVELRTKPLAKETYLLHWSALSLEDGHRSTGSTVFGVGVRPAVRPTADNALPGLSGLVLRWFDLAAIMLAIGALAVSGRVLGSMGPAGALPIRRARIVGALAAGAAVISGAITPFLRVPRAGSSVETWLDTTWTTLIATPWGNLWMARELVLVVAAVAFWSWALGRDDVGRGTHLAALALAGVAGLEALAGHAADLPRQSALVAVASALHLVAAGVWAGGLAVLALCLVPVIRREPEILSATLASVWRAFSPIAAVATVVLVATGLYEAGRYIPDLGSVGSTVYGGAVAGKAFLLVVVLVPAGLNALLVNPRLSATLGRTLGRPPGWPEFAPRHFVGLLVAELCVIVVAVAAAALATSVPTSREVGAEPEPSASGAANVRGLFVAFEEVSAGTDRIRLIVRARSTIKPEPAPISGVDVRLDGPTGTRPALSLTAVEPGWYQAETPSLGSGAWRAVVAVRRDGLPDAVTSVRWTTASPSDAIRPFERVTTVLAAMLLAFVACLVGVAVSRRPRPAGWVAVMEEQPGRQP